MSILTRLISGLVSSKTQVEDDSFKNEMVIMVNLDASSEEEKATTILQLIEVLEKEITIKNQTK